MKAYICSISQDEFEKRIIDFWDSRHEFDHIVWENLKNCCSTEIDSGKLNTETALAILQTCGVSLYRNCINAVFDPKGNLYEVPNYCINPPYKYIESSFDKSFEDRSFDLRIRCNMTEYKLKASTCMSVKQLKAIILNNLKEKDEIGKVRIFHGGKELKDKNNLHRFENNAILQMIIVKKDFIQPNPKNLLGALDKIAYLSPKLSSSSLKQIEEYDI